MYLNVTNVICIIKIHIYNLEIHMVTFCSVYIKSLKIFFRPNNLLKVTQTKSYLDQKLLRPKVTQTKCYLDQNVTQTKCYLDQTCLDNFVLDQVLLDESVLDEMLLSRILQLSAQEMNNPTERIDKARLLISRMVRMNCLPISSLIGYGPRSHGKILERPQLHLST